MKREEFLLRIQRICFDIENLTKESIENIINFPKNINNSKAKNELGLKISSLDKTVKDAIYR